MVNGASSTSEEVASVDAVHVMETHPRGDKAIFVSWLVASQRQLHG